MLDRGEREEDQNRNACLSSAQAILYCIFGEYSSTAHQAETNLDVYFSLPVDENGDDDWIEFWLMHLM
jgi:hypothetical protein